MALDTATCTMSDVIERSIAMHPTLFGEALASVAATHLQAAVSVPHHREASGIAKRMHGEAYEMAQCLLVGDGFEPAHLSLSHRIIAFGVACRLQCIPHHVASSIAGRKDA